MQFKGTVIAICVGITLLSGGAVTQETDLLALGEGTLPVVEPPSYGGWGPVNMLDDSPSSAWCSANGHPSDNVFVFEMLAPATIDAFEFDCTVDGPGRGAKDLIVEVSAGSRDAGFERVLQASLAEGKVGQRFTAARKVPGRWVRLTLVNNHGDPKYSELGGFRGYGLKPTAPPAAMAAITGTYSTNYNAFHLRQQGTAISGCYEHAEGLFEGMIEGRLAKITWNEAGGTKRGPAVFVFAPDGTSFQGYWWRDSDKGRKVDGNWTGKRVGGETGSCPHWSGSVGGELQKDLATTGRARLYGILFDTDSDRIRAESFPTLDEVVRVLSGEASWSLTIEGHTDSTGTPAHNQVLSEQRAKSVREYLTGKGVAAGRLTTAGFGQTKPVADNATELGRAQNRRVELVKR
jgi:outer membrane protein OmpA-like peptidoglycan-associated protein